VATAIRFVSMAIALSRAEFSGTFFVLPVVAGLFVFFVNQYDRTRASAATAAGEDPPFALWPIAFIAVLWTTVALVAFGIYSYS